jgi:hypothetical protein
MKPLRFDYDPVQKILSASGGGANQDFLGAVLDVLERAIAAERKACAKIADAHGELTSDTAHRIAAAIRARGDKPE